MITPEQIRKLDHLFPVFKQLSEMDRQKLFSAGQVVVLPDDQMLMQQNQNCQFIPMVMSGRLRIFKLSPNGREMTLYRIGSGETCLISIACQIEGEDYPAMAQVEEKATLYMLPAVVCHSILDHNIAWKDFLISSLYGHLLEVMKTLEAVAFERIDRRLILWLLEKTEGKTGTIKCTHESIAVELGTAREVVSRLLGELKKDGLVKLGRGKIEIENPARLKFLTED